MNKILIYTAFALMSLAFFACSKCKGNDPVFCEKGYENQNDNCVCPTGKYQTPSGNFGDQDSCRVLRSNEYYTITTGCPCEDTIFFQIISNLNGTYNANINKFRTGAGGGLVLLNYFPLSDGDSLNTNGTLNFEPCVKNNYPYPASKFFGKRVGTASITGKIIYYNGDDLIPRDSCSVIFRR